MAADFVPRLLDANRNACRALGFAVQTLRKLQAGEPVNFDEACARLQLTRLASQLADIEAREAADRTMRIALSVTSLKK